MRPALLAAVAAACALGLGVGATAILPTGLALVPVGIVTASRSCSTSAAVTGRSLRPSAVRTLVTQMRGTPA